MAVLKLTLSTFSLRRARVLLTVLAIAFSVSLVVSVGSGFASLRAAVQKYFTEFMGSTDVQITRTGDLYKGLPQSLLDSIREDPAVQSAVGRLETDTRYFDAEGKPAGREWHRASLVGVRLPDDGEIDTLRMEPGTGGSWWSGDRGDVAVIDQELAKSLNAKVGSEITIPGVGKQLRLKIIGIVHKPRMMAAIKHYIYMPLLTMQEFTGYQGQLSRILIDLRPGADESAFESRWKPVITGMSPFFKLTSARTSRKEIDKYFQGVELLSYLAGGVSMIAATFIIFSTLSMGVSERMRVLAMLRAVGAMRWQIGAVVVVEGLALALVGIALGVPLGFIWIKALATWKSDFFYAGVVLSTGGVLFGAVTSLLAALAASFLPAYTAMRISPLEGMSVQGQPRSRGVPLRAAIAGLILISIDPILLFAPVIPRPATLWVHLIAGLPTLTVGFFLLAPAFVWAVEKALAPAIAAMLRIRKSLLSQQLTGAVWRAAGTAAALMVGLSVLVVIQTRGNTILSGWRLPDKFPDMFIFAPLGLAPDEVAKLQTVPGIKPDEVLSMGIGVAGLPTGFFSGSIAGAAVLPDATLFLGVDPAKAMHMIDLEFRDGNAADAVRLLSLGRHVLVTEEFRQIKGLGLGDKIKLKTPQSGEVEYTVAGVIWSPGIDVFVAGFDMGRQFEERSAGTVFGSLEDAQRDFGVTKFQLFAANLQPAVDKKEMEQRVKTALSAWGLSSGDVREIKEHIQGHFHRIVMLVSTVAISAILVAALGVTNTIMASVRSRRWQFGILRSVGLTRWQMLRLILAEGLLLGLVGCALGLAAGFELSIDAARVGLKLVGYGPPMAVPWGMIGIGLLLTLGVAMIASLWPAISASREEPLHLLQAGRAAT